MRLRRRTPALTLLAVLAGLVVTPVTTAGAFEEEVPAEPVPVPVVELPVAAGQHLPFGCAEQWTGTTRPNHRPSVDAIDFNRPNDLGRLVVASAGGVVSRVADTGSRSYGKWIEVTHPEGFTSVYAHLKAQWVVPGQFVDQGAPIGRVGDTGGVTGAHLHFEQRFGRDVIPAYFDGDAFVHGTPALSRNCPDVPLSGDWNGDRADEVAVFRRDVGAGTFEMYSDEGLPAPVRFGRASDLPVSGDWDGDGVTDLGVRRQAARVFLLRTADGRFTRKRFGLIKDLPVTGDWDGNGTTDVGVYRPRGQRFVLLMADGTRAVTRLGGPGAQPVTGDWDGDGITDLGVFDTVTATFQLRTVTPDGYATTASVPLGSSTDLPVTGDWDGDGTTDVGTWTPGTATYTLRITPRRRAARYASGAELRTITFGRPR